MKNIRKQIEFIREIKLRIKIWTFGRIINYFNECKIFINDKSICKSGNADSGIVLGLVC
ncbi:hypothetical protein D3C87_674460 [compost metagenome]